MTIELFDTAQRAVVPFEVGPVVRMYVCGITPYDSTHLGHAATYLTYDLLIRRLEELGHEVRMVRNVTDVDDSILPKARELGVPYLELAEAELARFRSDMDALDTRPPLAEPRATESIEGMVDMVGRLRERLDVQGTGTSAAWPALLDSLAADPATPPIARVPDGFGPSDHASFYGRQIPVLAFFTGAHDEYHRPTDDLETIDPEGEVRVLELAARVVEAVAGGREIPYAEAPVTQRRAAAFTVAAMRPTSRTCCVVRPDSLSSFACDRTQNSHLPTIDAASA